MKTFLFKLLIFQTIFYASLWGVFYLEDCVLSDNGKIIWKPMLVIFYSISVLMTFVFPMIKLLIDENRKSIQ
jgi:hypothetical protein